MTAPEETTEPERPARVTGDERAQLRANAQAAYIEGRPIREVASFIGAPYGMTRRLLIEAGAELRTRGGNKRPGRGGRP